MSEVNASSIVDVQRGTKMVGALMAGNRKIYARFATYSFWTPGTFSFTLPPWAAAYAIIASGGGGGGRAGDGGKNAQGYGGKGGDIIALWGKLLSTHSKVLSGTIGAGGAGGKGGSSGVFGDNGGNTTFVNHLSNVYSAAGGTANPTSGMTDGGTTTVKIAEQFAAYYKVPPNSNYTNGPGGTGNAGAGKRGGGGAGGKGGFFGSYSHGGKGGDGFVEIYVWGMPPDEMTDRDTELITLGPDRQARDQFRAILADRGLDHKTITEIPFDIELVGSGSAQEMFSACSALTTVPEMDTSRVTKMSNMFNACSSLTSLPKMDTSSVTNMFYMFFKCSSLTSVPDMDTSQVTNAAHMLRECSSLTDGNVRLIGKRPDVVTTNMISDSGLTREPWYNADGTPHNPIEGHEVSLTGVRGRNVIHPLLTVTVPAGETWSVRIQGTVTGDSLPPSGRPLFRIGTTESGKYDTGGAVDFSGTVTATNSTIAMVTNNSSGSSSFTGTVTIEPWYPADGEPIPRKVTIEKNSAVAGFVQPATGDVSLIDGWIGSGSEVGAFFVAPVTCDRDLRNATNYSTIRAGDTIPAGQGVYPTYSQGTPYVFTEVV